MIEFKEFEKIPRYRREVWVCEKIDGTNAAIQLVPVATGVTAAEYPQIIHILALQDQHGTDIGDHAMLVQSRSQFIYPGKDNYGFAQWVSDNAHDLKLLGPGTHFGEWWGQGIQRKYGQDRKRFSLFNVGRWTGKDDAFDRDPRQTPPECCDVVPVLAMGQSEIVIDAALKDLRENGSRAAPGFKPAEGVVVWHSQSRQYYKVTLDHDSTSKSQALKEAV